ncbi:MAG: hypothetical protein MJZ81_06180 [Bacteroidales bacterium]|nr:hypothetical protein [Bacteroidales bacterium]
MADNIEKVKISELPLHEGSLDGFYTIGTKEVDGTPVSRKVELGFVQNAANAANTAAANANATATAANNAAGSANSAATQAQNAASAATQAKDAANAAATNATATAGLADTAAANAQAKASEAAAATTEANAAAGEAREAASLAQNHEHRLVEGGVVPALANNLETKDKSVNTMYDGGDDSSEKRESDPFVIRTSAGNMSVDSGIADILSLKGRTVKWNQLFDGNFAYNVAKETINKGNGYYTFVISAGTYYESALRFNVNIIEGHKYLFPIIQSGFRARVYLGSSLVIQVLDNIFVGVKGDSLRFGPYSLTEEATFSGVVQLYDLTAMGWDDIETYDEFMHRWKKLTGMTSIPTEYTEGKLLSFNPKRIWANGFNQWDEEWELGTLDVDGTPATSSINIRTKDFIEVFGGQTYFIKSPYSAGIGIYQYDANKTYITRGFVKDATLTLDARTAYIKFRSGDGVTTYNHGICINLAWSGVRNGEYEPYEEHYADIDVSSILDADGNQLFPMGLNKAGTVADDIDLVNRTATKRLGVVDMGSLTWTTKVLGVSTCMWSDSLSSVMGNSRKSVVCARYTDSISRDNRTISYYYFTIGYAINVLDSAYTDAAAFKAAMQGVMLVYELATPITVDLPANFESRYIANDYGLEAFVGDGQICAPSEAEISYLRNLKDQTRNHLDDHAKDWAGLDDDGQLKMENLTKVSQKMVVGAARNLVGKGSPSEDETFVSRISGGDNAIEDGIAEYTKIKGNTLVWNQTIKVNDISLTINKSLGSYVYKEFGYISIITGHKYLMYGNSSLADAVGFIGIYDTEKSSELLSMPTYTSKGAKIGIASKTGYGHVWLFNLETVTIDHAKVLVIDLTQMFGAGNEPATYEEFLRRKPKVADEYAYNGGELVSNTAEVVKTSGHNLVNQNDYYSPTVVYAGYECYPFDLYDRWSAKYSIPCQMKAGESYVLSAKWMTEVTTATLNRIQIHLKYADGTYRIRSAGNQDTTSSLTPYDKPAYLALNAIVPEKDVVAISFGFRFSGRIAYIIKDSLMINKGTDALPYEPYTEHSLAVGFKDIKDAEGNQLFPYGGLSAGNVHDEQTSRGAVKRIGVKVFDGTEAWNVYGSTPNYRVQNILRDGVTNYQTIVAARYSSVDWNAAVDMSLRLFEASNVQNLIFRDSNYESLEAWKQHLAELYAAGTPLIVYYELAEPVAVSYADTPQSFGVERYLDIETASGGREWIEGEEDSAPMVADIRYNIDYTSAVDRLHDEVGVAGDLATADKSTLVAAINELVRRLQALETAAASVNAEA